MTSGQDRRTDDLHFEGKNAEYWVRFSTLLAIAVVIATVGLYRDSAAVVIAAMLIAPLMTPILGIATSVVMGRSKRVLYLLSAVAVSSIGTISLAYLIMFVADAPRGMNIPSEVMARTDPGLEELMVALAAGIAGAYVQTRKAELSLLPGVAIGVALVPPLAAAGILLYFGEPERAWEATLLYLTNLAAIVLSACAVFLALGMRPVWRDKGYAARVGFGTTVTFIVVAIITFQLAEVTWERFREARDEERVVAAVRKWAGDHPIEVARVNVLEKSKRRIVELWVIFDAPLHLAEKVVAPREHVPPGLEVKDLFEALARVLGPDTGLALRAQIRYSGVVNLRTGRNTGLPPTGTE